MNKVVNATVTPDSFCPYPLIGRNIGLDDLLECARLAKSAHDVVEPIMQHAVLTRAQVWKEQKLELQAEQTRCAECPLIKKPEEVSQLVATTDENSEISLTTPSGTEEGEVSEPGLEAKDTSEADKNGMQVVAEVNSEVGEAVNVGLVIPSIELGASLGKEYRNSLARDDTLKEWNGWEDQRKHGFMWDQGLLKWCVDV